MAEKTFKVTTEIFEGPLDLLLQLIEKRKLHINDVSLAHITDDYLTHIEKLTAFPLGQVAHFILIASTLVLIKSRSLLPTLTLSEEEEEDIESLERRLKEYRRIKELSEYVGTQFNTNVIFAAPYRSHVAPVFSPTSKVSLQHLSAIIKQFLHSLPKKEIIPQVVVQKMISLEDTITSLTRRIQKDLKLHFNDFACADKADKISIVISFLAVLELVKRGVVAVKQDKYFEDILIESKQS